MRSVSVGCVLLGLVLSGCETVVVPEQLLLDRHLAPGSADGGGGTDTGPPRSAETLAPVAALARASLDLRGTRPTLAEIQSVETDPAAYSALVAGFAGGEAFADRAMWIWNDALHTGAWAADYTRFDALAPEQIRSLGQAPLRMVRAVVAEDRPFTDLVTADQLQADDRLAALWGIAGPASPDADGWGWVTFPDDRPMAGVLSSSTLWLRYSPDRLQRNRVRANALASIFLCADFLAREGSFSFDIDAEDLSDIEDAVATQGECLACHASLDPLASLFGGFTWRSDRLSREATVTWSHHQADLASAEQQPAYYGVPVSDLEEAGALMAQDPRFARCGVERLYTGLVGTPPPAAARHHLTETFTDASLRLPALAEAIVHSDPYLQADPRVLTPEQLATSLRDLLGVPPEDPGARIDEGLGALLWSGEHRILGGGTDDITVLARNRTAGLGLQVLAAWAARGHVDQAVEQDLARPLDARLLVATDATDEASVRAALAPLHTRMLSVVSTADDPAVDRLFALWTEAGGADDPQTAWSTVVEALVRHPLQVLY